MKKEGQKISKYLYYYLGLNKKNSHKNTLPALDRIKKEYIVYLLELTNNNLIETAEILNITQAVLQKELDKYSLGY